VNIGRRVGDGYNKRVSSELRFPDLDPGIDVLAGTDVQGAWDRFEVFEALHHPLRICNPMTSDQLDEMIDWLEPSAGASMVDFGCGYGEVLIRCAARAAIDGRGVDLSPWMIAEAHRRAQQAGAVGLGWTLGEAKHFLPSAPLDIAVCLGAEWLWHDVRGTARALRDHLGDGGVAAIGAPRLHFDADNVVTNSTDTDNTDTDRALVEPTRGVIETIADQDGMLNELGFDVMHRIDPDDAGWDAYLASTERAAAHWAERNPGTRAQQWQADQREWQEARDRDRDVIGWSVWIARKRSATQ
jgi:SAM-dependent methyltransferase